MTMISFNLNGRPREADAPPSTPLLYVLRDELGLNGPRYGCGLEQCGACRVLIDGELAWSCSLPVGEVEGKTVTTVEGLSPESHLHPLQDAFLEFNAAQCGYCMSGILISSAKLLGTNPSPTREDVQQALDDHLCRCGSHNRVIKAVLHAAERMRESRDVPPPEHPARKDRDS